MSILRTVARASVAWALSLSALALSSGAHADECDATAAKVSAAIPGLMFLRRVEEQSGVGPEVHLRHNHGGTIEIICLSGMKPAVTIDTNTLYPPKAFLELVAKAGSAETGSPVKSILSAIEKCHLDALKTGGGDPIEVMGAEVGCTVLRDPPLVNFEIVRRNGPR